MKKESPLRSSISLLIGIVIAILALVRGRMLLPLLLAVFALWLLWWLLTQALPLWCNNRAYRAKEARLREQTAAAKDGGQLADALLCHVNYRITAMLHAAYPNARWEWLADKPSRFAVEGGTARIRVYGIKRATACSQTPICRRKSLSLAWDSEIRTSTTPTSWIGCWERRSLPAPLKRSRERTSAVSIRCRSRFSRRSGRSTISC